MDLATRGQACSEHVVSVLSEEPKVQVEEPRLELLSAMAIETFKALVGMK